MKRIVLGVIATLVSACSGLAAPAVPDAVREQVEALYVKEHQDMVDPEQPDAFKIAVPAEMYSSIDINDDGVPDWIVSYEAAQNASFFCGTGGCRREIYVSRNGGYVLALARTVGTFKLGRTARRAGAPSERFVDIDFHGSICGGAGADECKRRYVWDEAAGRFFERPNRKGETWLVGGPSPVVEIPLTQAPAAVAGQIKRREAFCKAAGGAYPTDETGFNDLPDLNGDGVRDWVIGTFYDYCEMGETGRDSPPIPTSILISKDGGFVVAFEAPETNWGIDLAPAPTFMTLEGPEGCGYRKDGCARVAWRWNGEKLVRAP